MLHWDEMHLMSPKLSLVHTSIMWKIGPLLPKTFHLRSRDPNASIKTKRLARFKGEPHMAAIGELAHAPESFEGHKGIHLDSSSPRSANKLAAQTPTDTHRRPPLPPPLHSVLLNVTQTPDSIKDPPRPPEPTLLEWTERAKHHPGPRAVV